MLTAPPILARLLRMNLSEVASEGVSEVVIGDPWSKCKSTIPIAGSAPEGNEVVIRSLSGESREVPDGCDRALTFSRNGDVSIDIWNGHTDLWSWRQKYPMPGDDKLDRCAAATSLRHLSDTSCPRWALRRAVAALGELDYSDRLIISTCSIRPENAD